MNANDHTRSTRRPGDRLIERLWFKALASGGRLPMPTIERIQALKCLVAKREANDEDEATSAG